MRAGRTIAMAGACALAMVLSSGVRADPPFGKGDKGFDQDMGPGAGKSHGNSGHGKNKDHGRKNDDDWGSDGAAVGFRFESNESRMIRDYFGAHPVRSKPLPPGIAKNLARGKPLPPGIAKRYLPDGLVAGLPPRPGYERLLVGNDVVLVSVATGLVVDILAGALH